MKSITLRTADATDLEVITMNNCAMAQEAESRRLDRETASAGVRRVLTDPARGVYYVAERDGKVIGQLLITREWSDWRDGWFWWIQSVYVTPAARRQGVFRALYQHAEAQARRQADVCGLRLYVERNNAGAQEVYERLGMKRTTYRLYELEWDTAQ